MGEWQDLAELLVEVDIQIEELNGWATRPEDIAELDELEELRTDLRFALTFHHVPRGLRKRLRRREREGSTTAHRSASEPRD